MPKITFFDSFLEDKRVSINYVTEQVKKNCEAGPHSEWQHEIFRPTYRTQFLSNRFNLADRVARFIDYPIQANKQKTDIAHVMEDGYAHLSPFIHAQKKVLTVTDLMPLLGYEKTVQGLSYPHNPYLFKFCLKFLNSYDRIVTQSWNTKQDLISRFSLEEEKITIIPLAADETLFDASKISKSDARKKLGLPDKSVIILISGKEQYKNLETSIKAFCRIKELHPYLDIQLARLGGNAPFFNELIIKYQLDPLPRSFSGLSREEVALLYRASNILFFPSFYEGFGLPPLEAMATGTPVVVSNRASLPEVVGKDGLIIDAQDEVALSDLAIKLITDDSFYRSVTNYGLERSSHFTWRNYASSLSQVYEKLLTNI
jgi:glycosyltransferase involved in cell wall biosynthesis